MASLTSTKTQCATCGNKGVGIFKCEGCSATFCRKHANEHRDMLSHQLDEIVFEHDALQQTIIDHSSQEKNQHFLIKQINQWEQDSIIKIQQVAEETRQQVELLISSHKGNASKELFDLAERLRKARIDDDYVENDLCTWTTMLEKLKRHVTSISRLINIYEDPTKILVAKICISETKSYLKQNEKFGESVRNILIEDHGYVAIHTDSKRCEGFARGICEYSSGKHKIQFVLKQTTAEYYCLFGIMSKTKSIPQTEAEMKTSTYGWCTNDKAVSPHGCSQVSKDFRDMKCQIKFEIELFLDCDNQKIIYFNQQTKNTREMNVDVAVCSFPWQLLFYLYDVEDRIQLISSSQEL
ncbi:unnamed protein product [Rotaria sp. Silwood2]|nr:unnamed protein product [Rotaria sp. Silwood2]CAF2984251.1 unnamed protein product [Rotaria sp. Silwood2]CAF3001602.1 unnamed protein product [Rotaria sp. Silwood2]CAF3324227.1 unnamed protein product [Rotaria sp. Silwood2]CAF4010383.1 unnamed protein product [Rotaria sp. Silwood2]